MANFLVDVVRDHPWALFGFLAVLGLVIGELLRRLERARRALAERDDRIASVAHELRGPLQPIALAASRIKRDGGLSTKQAEAVAVIERNLEAEARMVEDLLEATRGARGPAIHAEPCDANAVVREITDAALARAAERRIELEIHLDPSGPHVTADPVRLRQIVRNLVDNALKFTPPGGRVTVRTDRGDGRTATIEVADTGIGIPPEERERIFDAYVQGTEGAAAGGLGLGLYLVRRLVLAHGGSLVLRSAGRGKGSSFTVSLPRASAPERSHAPGDVHAAGGGASPERRGRILLVEDHEDSARMIGDLLRSRGFEVTAVGTVAAAAAEGARTRYDVLVSDLELPDGSGLDLMRRLFAGPALAGVALSGRRTEADLAESRRAGFAEHLQKPLDVEELVLAIERVRPR